MNDIVKQLGKTSRTALVGFVGVGLERVGREVVVRGADVGVAQPFAHPPQGAVVVADEVLIINDDRHAELLGQVEEVLYATKNLSKTS